MNTNVRHNCLEVPLNDAEKARIEAHCVTVGMARSVFARFSMLHLIESNGKADVPPMESRPCRDTPVASRASQGAAWVSHRHRSIALPNRNSFGKRTPKRTL